MGERRDAAILVATAFHQYPGFMEKSEAVNALSALAHETRLDVFRLLVRKGVDGLSAGDIAATLEVPPATLSFHLAALSQARLVSKRRESRSIIYAADFATMDAMLGYLTENCCAGDADIEQSRPSSAGTARRG